ncbi:MAG: choice-of-anchor J domain-containing protein [Chitinophagaceae bacterium]
MRKNTLKHFLFPFSFIAVVFLSCGDDKYLTVAPPPPDVSFTQEFDSINAAYDKGWRYYNVSSPKGTGFWAQGLFNNPVVTGFPAPIPFPAWSSKGTYVGYIGADYTSTSAASGIISNWVVSPVTLIKAGDKIVFYTRGLLLPTATTDSTDYANRLQVRVNTYNDGTNVGTGTDPGDFAKLILDINPKYAFYHSTTSLFDPTAYPSTWTRFEATVDNLPAPVNGRFAFRYFVEGGGSNGLGTAVAIDSVAYISAR